MYAGCNSQARRVGQLESGASMCVRKPQQLPAGFGSGSTRIPMPAIGVVVPELAAQRDIVIHALDEILVPHALQPGRQSVARPYNISLGPPLSAYPIISTALKLLGLLARSVSQAVDCSRGCEG